MVLGNSKLENCITFANRRFSRKLNISNCTSCTFGAKVWNWPLFMTFFSFSIHDLIMELESSVKSKECTSKSFVLRLRSQNNSLTHASSIDKCANDWILEEYSNNQFNWQWTIHIKTWKARKKLILLCFYNEIVEAFSLCSENSDTNFTKETKNIF